MKNISSFALLISLSFLLFSCSNKTEKVESPTPEMDDNRIVFKHKEQEFKIFTYYDEFEGFLESAKKQPDNIDKLYEEAIVKPVSSDMGIPRLKHWMLTHPKDVVAM